MFTILILVLIGKNFYELAQEYGKHRWLYVLIGIAIYYASIFAIIYGITYAYELYWIDFGLNSFDILKIEFIFSPLIVVILYVYLNLKWKKETKIKNEINDIGKED